MCTNNKQAKSVHSYQKIVKKNKIKDTNDGFHDFTRTVLQDVHAYMCVHGLLFCFDCNTVFCPSTIADTNTTIHLMRTNIYLTQSDR